MSATPTLANATALTRAGADTIACVAPALATRDAISDDRRPTMVRRLFSAGGQAGVVLEAMRRVCEREGLRLMQLDALDEIHEQPTPRSVAAWVGRCAQHDASAWSRLLTLAARPDIDLVIIGGDAATSALSPCIARAVDDTMIGRVAEAHGAFEQRQDLPPRHVPSPTIDDASLVRVERLLADGRRGQARQFLAAQIARAERRGRGDDDMLLRIALARLAHEDLDPSSVCRVLLPALQRSSRAPDVAAADGQVHHMLRAAILACHASIDLLQLHQAQQLAGGTGVVADALGDCGFEAAHAQWRVCWWMGDIDGALAQVARLDGAARTAMHQVVARRCAVRTCAIRWPDDAAGHRQWLRQHIDERDRERAGLVRRALAEDALATGDLSQARVYVDAARRAYGRRLSTRTRACLAILALAADTARAACGDTASRVPLVIDRATPLLAMCVEAVRAGSSAARRRRAEQRAASVGLAIAHVAPWHRPTGDHVMIEDLLQVIEACHTEEGVPAMARLCSLVREQLGAAGVGLYTTPEGRPLAGVGTHPCVSANVAREALARGVVVEPAAASIGLEGAVPVRFGGTPIAALCCRWAYDAPVDRRRATLVMSAVAAVCAPVVQTVIDARARLEAPADDLGLLGTSDGMRVLRVSIRRAGAAPFPVLIEGESGAGKELVARAIHAASPRRSRRFCAVNCAAVSDELLEAELFGHARGAFTGAVSERPGLFEEADGGTLFLDEIGELSPRGQAKLLRVLQEGEVRRVGENVPRRLDVRVVAATNRTLAREVEVGRFRDDLRFRLDVVRINVPPLRARPDDIEVLAQAFWRDALTKTRGRAVLERDAIAALARYDWPGNVRELQNVIATLAVRAPLRGRVTEADVTTVRGGIASKMLAPVSTLDAARREFDAAFLRQTLAECGGRRTEAARRLGVTRQGLLKLMHRLGLDRTRGGRAIEGAATTT